MMGQTRDIVPADRLLYALRDVTGTVESIPLITASILSKKIAEGADALVFDVKYGKGAFMKSLDDAELLAESLVKTATSLTGGDGDVKAAAVITNMDSPLGYKVGNFLEIEETIECLQGQWPADVKTVTYELAAQMLLLGGKAKTQEEAAALIDEAVTSGKALGLFYRNVDRQGGDAKLVAAQCGKRRSPHRADVTAAEDGYVAIDAFQVGLAGVTLGVGRNRTEDAVCPDAGLVLHAKEGEKVHRGDLLMEVYGKDDSCLESAVPQLAAAVTYSEKPLMLPPLIAKLIKGDTQ
jgi:pyrimidine-nucleoside phosphorylase